MVKLSSSANSEGLLDENSRIGVGFSDWILLAVSVTGFCFLAVTIYSIIILRLKSKEELEKEDLAVAEDYEDQLVHADVSKLNRAQRRARAHALMKQRRRIAPLPQPAIHDHDNDNDDDQGAGEGDQNENNENNAEDANFLRRAMVAIHNRVGENNENDEDDDDDDEFQKLPRKERQKLAKAIEKEERRLFQEERRKKQLQAEELAQREKRQREKLLALQQEEERRKQKIEIQAQEEAANQRWKTFLSSPIKTQSVEEWNLELQQNRSVHVHDIAESYQIPVEIVEDRIRELVRQGRVTGIFTTQGQFVSFTKEELQSMVSSIQQSNRVVTQADVANICNETIGQ